MNRNPQEIKYTKNILFKMVKSTAAWLNTAQSNINDWNAHLVNCDLQFATEDARLMDEINYRNISAKTVIVPSFNAVIRKLNNFLLFKVQGIPLFSKGSDNDNKAKAQKLVNYAEQIIINNAPVVDTELQR